MKLNLFELLQNLDEGNLTYYRELTPELRKQFSPFMAMQWLSCTKNNTQLILLNELVNRHIFTLHKHPELLYYLLTICTSGTKQFYKWKKPPSTATKFPISVAVIKEALEYSTSTAIASLAVLSVDDILEIAHDLGYQKDMVSKLKTELKNK